MADHNIHSDFTKRDYQYSVDPKRQVDFDKGLRLCQTKEAEDSRQANNFIKSSRSYNRLVNDVDQCYKGLHRFDRQARLVRSNFTGRTYSFWVDPERETKFDLALKKCQSLAQVAQLGAEIS